jgi:hypothetical protein
MYPFGSAVSGGARWLRCAALHETASASPEAERLMNEVARAMGGAEAILGIQTLQAESPG